MNALVFNLRRFAFVSGLLAMMLISSLAVIPASRGALAGSNGQQIVVYNCYASYIIFQGSNQNGTYVTRSFATNWGTTQTYNSWWKGWIKITSFGPFGSTVKWLYVPEYQGGSDWTPTWGCT